ncbi:MAG TPA: tRNA (adenosine(37)-N6)-threonylcarbamoyltransferase complex ATPase subunit type 1 TsaE [candidate division Zixibacteria bacterium]|nr:tRNA (adenosine(37)-N6)-threonylcarbamoyltransferase complex ATPase subunit type 1 TsaE [candidate division Zixibacteria bacterium]
MRLRLDFISRSAEQTSGFGGEFAGYLREGDVVAFTGDLGAGKTTMIKGIARALGFNETEVSSPSFAIIHEYIADKIIYHIDLYRVEKHEDIAQLGLWEIFEGEGISLVEWADRGEELLPQRVIRVSIDRISDSERKITVRQM